MKPFTIIEDIVLSIAVAAIVISLIAFTTLAFAENPHHPIPEPVVNITNVTHVVELPDVTINTYIQDEGRLEKLTNTLNAVTALSGLQTISLPNGGTGGSISISKYDSYGGAVSLQHRYDDVNFGINYGSSQGEDAVSISVGGQFK